MTYAPATISQRMCPKCGGTGRWVNPNNPDDRRDCFGCNGTGRTGTPTRALRAPSRSGRRFVAEDFLDGVTLASDGGDGGDAPAGQQAGQLDPRALALDVASRVESTIRDEVASATARVERDVKGWTRVELDVLAKELEERVYDRLAKRLPQRIELTRGDVVLPQIEGHQHPSFAKLLRLATSRGADGFVPNIWITGPAGSGKTTGARMLAKALELPFFYNGALETKFEVIGYSDAGGTYHTTAFREAMEQPSVYLFDDIDSCDSNAPLLALNGALANGLIAFPDKHLERHHDSIVIATANTWGLGATADYVGRMKLDGAFTDRFGGKVTWGYDEEFERAISGNSAWAKRVQAARSAAQAAGLKVLITPRASIAGAAYIAAGFTFDEAAELTYLANLSAEQRRILQ